MIVKDPEPQQSHTDPLRRAGHEAERQMAHYLKRAFRDDPLKSMFNDLRLERQGEVAQLDHLIVYRFGVIVVESKSVAGQVSVNERGEWTRWWKGQGRGMPSPILQARRQLDLLGHVLSDQTEGLLDRSLFGLRQRRFDGMRRDVLVAISDGGRISRKTDVPEVVKADQVADRVREIITAGGGLGTFAFSDAELTRIAAFLSAQHSPLELAASKEVVSKALPDLRPSTHTQPTPEVACRSCASPDVAVQYGKYGYYLNCRSCEGKTPAKPSCAHCGQPGRLSKAGREFTATCGGGHSWPYFTNPADA